MGKDCCHMLQPAEVQCFIVLVASSYLATCLMEALA